tara:strand:- start:25 stop:1029 length:1005 start_codon:yes stop_codon:yes gene_type:complete
MKTKNLSTRELHSMRVLFKSDAVRKNFFADLKCHFGTWKGVGNKFNIYKSRLELLRKATISIPYVLFLEFLSVLDSKEIKSYTSQIILKDRYWGCRKGGITTYERHPELVQKSRIKGARSPKRNYYSFPMNMQLTAELSELLGAFIGDGFTNKYGRTYVVQFTGHAKLDNNYLSKKLFNLVKKICPNARPILRKTDANTLRLTINSKELFYLLTKRFKFPAGKKSHTVVIPREVVESDQTVLSNCIRGIFDTDGCVFVDRRETYSKPYIRIALDMRSKRIIKQIHSLLNELGIHSTVAREHRLIQINGFKNCEKFVRRIGFSNLRHSDKIAALL